jgi:hypothetical protein
MKAKHLLMYRGEVMVVSEHQSAYRAGNAQRIPAAERDDPTQAIFLGYRLLYINTHPPSLYPE